jgi:16S rRNA (guanine966-N2)-methyltransferase
MRIIAGKFRSRQLLSPPSTITRPTADRARESIFNIINNLGGCKIEDATVLDAFAGSGALGLEALSRGAAHVTFLEKNLQAINILKENIASLDISSQCSVIQGDATRPPKAPHPMKLMFLDPPYDQTIEEPCLMGLQHQGWINSETLIVLETSTKRALNLPTKAALIDQRRYGAALISFLSYGGED